MTNWKIVEGIIVNLDNLLYMWEEDGEVWAQDCTDDRICLASKEFLKIRNQSAEYFLMILLK